MTCQVLLASKSEASVANPYLQSPWLHKVMFRQFFLKTLLHASGHILSNCSVNWWIRYLNGCCCLVAIIRLAQAFKPGSRIRRSCSGATDPDRKRVDLSLCAAPDLPSAMTNSQHGLSPGVGIIFGQGVTKPMTQQ